MIFDLHDVPNFGDDPAPENDLLSGLGIPPQDHGDIVDFTFRIPKVVPEEAKALAREVGCSTNAAFAGLVDIGLRTRGARVSTRWRLAISTICAAAVAGIRLNHKPELALDASPSVASWPHVPQAA